MKRFVYCVVGMVASLCVVQRIYAQSLLEYWSDTPTDARSNALGEAFVSVARGPSAMFYNVAGLNEQPGAAFEFSSRHNVFVNTSPGNPGVTHTSLTGTWGTGAWGSVGIRYTEFTESFSEFERRGTQNELIGTYQGTLHIPDVCVAYAGTVSPTLDAGAGIGLVQYTWTMTPIGNSPPQSGQNFSAPYVTFGFRYHESILKSATPDEFSFSASLNHLGAPLAKADSLTNAMDLARSFRAGIAWRIAQPDSNAFGGELFSSLISGQFKKVLNEAGYSSDYLTNNSGYWSLGLEVGAFNAIFFRYGLQYRPYTNQFGYRNNAQSNAGIGVRIPVHKIFRFDTPAWINVDYAIMFMLNNQQQSLVSLGFHIDHDFFPAPPPEENQE